jgi:PHD/YefM family antitoxin component YafN of YafNO toxin-antitoxin module
MSMPEENKNREIQYVVDESGKRVAVILPVEEFEAIMDTLEELEDIRDAEEARREIESGEDEFIPWEQAKKEIEEERARLKREGIV